MDLHAIKKCLLQIDLFSSFSKSDLHDFAENISEVVLEIDESIFNEGDCGQEMYILLDGIIKIYKKKRFITKITPIDYLGEMAIIEDKPRSATAIAGSTVTLLKISASMFQKYLTKQPRSLVAMMKTLSGRIRSDTLLLAEEYQRANILIHDMRNRLSAFLLLDIFDKSQLPEESQCYIKIMRDSCHDLAIMMDEALTNAKHLKFNRSYTKGSINCLILDLHRSEFLLHPALHNKNIILHLADDIKDFTFCEIDIRRVLTNLLINAGQASPEKSTIHITTHNHGKNIEILVQDNGYGIPKEIHSKIFTPRFTTKPDGNGLGLSSCQDIVKSRHHGALSFRSTDKGTTFQVTLPTNVNVPNID